MSPTRCMLRGGAALVALAAIGCDQPSDASPTAPRFFKEVDAVYTVNAGLAAIIGVNDAPRSSATGVLRLSIAISPDGASAEIREAVGSLANPGGEAFTSGSLYIGDPNQRPQLLSTLFLGRAACGAVSLRLTTPRSMSPTLARQIVAQPSLLRAVFTTEAQPAGALDGRFAPSSTTVRSDGSCSLQPT
jgi:hypothetical protein